MAFGIFRQYQRVALAAVAIMAMLAFFVLPPFLQMGSGGGGGADPLVVSWRGGGLRESDVQRAVFQRRVMNQFIAETLAASGQDPSRMRLLDDEKDVVDTLLLAREADANGVEVSNDAINRALAEWTGDMVRPEQFEQISAGIAGRTGMGQEQVFEAIRTVLKARRLESLLVGGLGYEGVPPGWKWDYFRRLEQAATIEAVPVVVESLVSEVREPSETELRALYERHRNDLPQARSTDPGFRKPHRARWEYLLAKAGAFEDESAKEITDERISAFYEERKDSLYRVKETADEPKADAADPGGDAGPQPQPDAKDGSAAARAAVRTVAFRQPADASATPAAEDSGPAAGAAAEANAAPGTQPQAEPAPADTEHEPLEKVKDDIRARLTREAAAARVTAIFDAVKADVDKYGQAYALWQVADEGSGPAPRPPDVAVIAEKQGLESGRSELLSAQEAFAAGGIGGSFELMMSAELGMRQRRWVDMIFGRGVPLHEAVTSRDVAGNRYVSWKVEDQPEFTPSFTTVRDEVRRAWKIIEGRPRARKRSEDLAAAAARAGGALADLPERGGAEVVKAGPFTWLTRGTAPFGSAPELSQPDGISMPGEAFMEAVFGLEPGGTAVAFNEPQTVCYCIRLVALEPDASELENQFLTGSSDPRRLAAVADEDTRGVYERWLESLEDRYDVEWKREPRFTE